MPLKIIQILPELDSGGVERGTLELGAYLTQLGHESVVISHGGRLVEALEAQGSKHILLPVHKKRISSLKYVRALSKVIEAENADILHLRSRLPAWLAWLAWRKMDPQTRPRLVTTVHGFYSVNAYSRVMTRGESVICVSESVRDYVLKNYPKVPPSALSVIHRGVSPETIPYGFQAAPEWLAKWKAEQPQLAGQYVINLPARLTRWKGPLDLIEIVEKLRNRGLPAHGLIVGEAHPRKLEFLEEIKTAITRAGLEKAFTILGHRSDLREVMSVSDVVISCSTDPEAFGRVTLEALAMGRPVAGYDHGGVREQLSELLPAGRVPIGDTTAFANLLEEWKNSPPAPRSNNPFTLQAMLSKTLGVYQKLLQSPRETAIVI